MADLESGSHKSESRNDLAVKVETNGTSHIGNTSGASSGVLTGYGARGSPTRVIDAVCIWLGIMFLLSFFWKNNVGSGALPAGAPDLIFEKNDTDGTTAAYYVFFIVCAIPSVLIQERLVKPKVWIPLQLFMIGVIACGFAAVKSTWAVYPVRVFWGIFEAGFFPGIVAYLCHWYTRYQTGLRITIVWSVGTIIGSASYILAYMFNLGSNGLSGLSGWVIIFITYGLLTVVLGIASYWLIRELPRTTSLLTAEEKEYVIEAVTESRGDYREAGEETVVNALLAVFKNVYVWAFVLLATIIGFPLANYASFCLSVFAHMTYNGDNLSPRQQLIINIPPYFVALVLCIASGFYSDKLRRRGIYVALASIVAVLGFILLVSNQNTVLNYQGVLLTCAGLNTMFPLVIIWGTENVQGPTQRAIAAALIYAIPQAAAPVTQFMFKAADGPEYLVGYGVSLALTAVAGIFAYVLSRHLKNSTTLQH